MQRIVFQVYIFYYVAEINYIVHWNSSMHNMSEWPEIQCMHLWLTVTLVPIVQLFITKDWCLQPAMLAAAIATDVLFVFHGSSPLPTWSIRES